MTLFINSDYMFENSFVDKSTNPTFLASMIGKSQEKIRMILGTNLYNKMHADVSNDVLTASYTTLMDEYIKPALKWWTIYNVFIYGNIKITNSGISQKSGDSFSAADKEAIDPARNDARNMAEYLSQQITDYIRDNETSYPEYFELLATGKSPLSNSYYCGMYIPKKY